MIEKIKYGLSAFLKGRQMRLRIAALLTALAVASATLLNYCSIHTIKIFDGHKTYTVRSLNNNVAMAMENIALKSDTYEVLETKTSDNVTSVQISYGYPVYITMGDKTTEINFYGGTVEDALKTAGFTPDKFDFVEPSLETVITESTYIDYTDINYVESTKEETIPHDTKTVYSDNLKKGTKKVTTEGKDGIKQVTYTEKLVNGVSVEKKVTQTVTLTKAVDEKITVGTKIVKKTTTSKKTDTISVLSPEKEIELDENGVPISYKSKMTVRATAYTHTGNKCATGVSPKPGYIAVNPKVIPYGTKMFIKTSDGKYIYGYAVAADTGGFVKNHPTGVDLFFDTESECRNFGVRSVEIYILD